MKLYFLCSFTSNFQFEAIAMTIDDYIISVCSALCFNILSLFADMEYVIEMHFWHTFGLSSDQNTCISYTENIT